MINKNCVECSKEFTIEIKKGSGGISCLKRKYCSETCKRKWKQKNGNNNLIEVLCCLCNKEIKKFPSLVKEKNYCSKKCQNIALNGIQEIAEKQCEVCNKKYTYIASSINGKKQKYCSVECATKRPIVKTGLLVKCYNCGIDFYSKKYIAHKRKYCSDPCQFEAQSKGIKRLPTNGRAGYRSDLPMQYFKSAFEADYARFLIQTNTEYEYEKHTFKVVIGGKEKFYTPDFYIPSQNKYIELKGAKNREKYNKNIYSALYLAENGKNIDIIYMKDFYSSLKESGLYDTMFLEVKNYKKTSNIIMEKNDCRFD